RARARPSPGGSSRARPDRTRRRGGDRAPLRRFRPSPRRVPRLRASRPRARGPRARRPRGGRARTARAAPSLPRACPETRASGPRPTPSQGAPAPPRPSTPPTCGRSRLPRSRRGAPSPCGRTRARACRGRGGERAPPRPWRGACRPRRPPRTSRAPIRPRPRSHPSGGRAPGPLRGGRARRRATRRTGTRCCARHPPTYYSEPPARQTRRATRRGQRPPTSTDEHRRPPTTTDDHRRPSLRSNLRPARRDRRRHRARAAILRDDMRITVLGAGYMGSAMACVARRRGHDVHLWGTWLDDAMLDPCERGEPHPRLKQTLDGIVLFRAARLSEALGGAELVIHAVNSEGALPVMTRAADHLPDVPVL